ncbi:MAG: hypothetical protein M3N08_06025 [Pseudomonadota bacterium]|nr:hypothetical protein [Pseudomonadota bacterium]
MATGEHILEVVQGVLSEPQGADSKNPRLVAQREQAALAALFNEPISFSTHSQAEDIVRALSSIVSGKADAGLREAALQLMEKVIEREQEDAEDDSFDKKAVDWREFRVALAPVASKDAEAAIGLAGAEVAKPAASRKHKESSLVELLHAAAHTDPAPPVRVAAEGLVERLQASPLRGARARAQELALTAVAGD